MSKENAISFIMKIQDDSSIQEEMKSIENEQLTLLKNKLVKLGASKGFDFSTADYDVALKELIEKEHSAQNDLSEEDLKKVAGGFFFGGGGGSGQVTWTTGSMAPCCRCR